MTSTDKNKSGSAQRLKKKLCGVFLPITTPFRNDESIDLDGLRSNIGKWNEAGVAGYILLGSTGERAHLDENERAQIVATARELVSERQLFVVGAGQQSTYSTIKEIERIAGAVPLDAVLVITPSFYRSSITQEALVTHYQNIADESPVPVVLYSMPALTGIKIEPETAARLSKHENIVGIKDSSADIEGIRKTIELTPGDFAVLIGNGTVFQAGLRLGACGGILAVGCVAHALCVALFEAVNNGEFARAEELQSKLTPIGTAVTTRFGIGGLKAALEMKNYTGGTVRAPLRLADDVAREEIRLKLVEADSALNVGASSRR